MLYTPQVVFSVALQRFQGGSGWSGVSQKPKGWQSFSWDNSLEVIREVMRWPFCGLTLRGSSLEGGLNGLR